MITLLLHNVRSTHNVGSLFRTADAMGVSAVVLCGITPAPTDRFGREVKDIAKVALGAEKTILWSQVEHPLEEIQSHKQKGFCVVALEQHEGSVSLESLNIKKDILLIVGNEITGLPAEVLASADYIAEIPMRGTKESLNVSVAGGIALYVLSAKS